MHLPTEGSITETAAKAVTAANVLYGAENSTNI